MGDDRSDEPDSSEEAETAAALAELPREQGTPHEAEPALELPAGVLEVTPPMSSPQRGAEQMQQRARLAEGRLSEVLAAYRQLKVENEGFRDRITRTVQRSFERRGEKLLLRFIEVFDNVDRALEAAEQTCADRSLIEGLILVRSQLLQILQKEGLEWIPVRGLPFDPAVSEAVGTQPVTDPEHDRVVVRELLRGYRLHGRVARPSRVVVGEYRLDASAADGGEPLIGAEEPPAAQEGVDPAAETTRLDEETLRAILGGKEPGAD